ncbi:MAG TPA: UDP-N-acetylglucosamine 2-epimerase (non-hydrolyzing) [Vicinamibacterales bacterium]|nr:UDP-N-acetylglucosamine 2-epimerase (non-hydrolyzing) [Vicinamibacterales bacterium]
MHIMHVVGARPAFMKVAAVLHELRKSRRARQTLVHTGEWFARTPADLFLQELGVRRADVHLGVGMESSAGQIAGTMLRLEQHLVDLKPDLVLVYGDGNATIAAALTATKLGIDVGHVEAGLRSRDRRMPQEINRVLVDRMATWLFTPSNDADENLLAEGADPAAIKLVGNVMIDTLVRLMPQANPDPLLQVFGLMNSKGPAPYAVATLHKPLTAEGEARFEATLDALTEITRDVPVIFPVDPDTRRHMKDHHLRFSGLLVTEPLTYLQFLGLERHARVVITDSGGIQEETTYLGVPCLTVRDATDRPVTVSMGTNVVVGGDPEHLKTGVAQAVSGRGPRGSVPPLWDGRAAERIVGILMN